MRRLALLFATIASLLAIPAAAQSYTYTYEEVTEEWVDSGAQRFVSPQLAQAERAAIAAYGPFRVLDQGHAALVGITDSQTPGAFARMLADYPGLTTLSLIDCPGTYDDRANLRLGHMIREAGLAVEVPDGGSVRSGGVELVLAGRTVTIADGAEFAVHAWLDDRGLGALDYAPDSPEHAKYLDYYRAMGMTREAAVQFYAMTNAVPFESALWLNGSEMRGWLDPAPQFAAAAEAPRLAYLDVGDLDLLGALN